MNTSNQSTTNKALALEAFDTLFNRRDHAAAERFWSPDYLQHSAHIAPGREGLFALVCSLPDTLRYESGLVVAEGDFVILHGRFSGFGQPVAWIVADILRIKDGILVEHWDVIQDEAMWEQVPQRDTHVQRHFSRTLDPPCNNARCVNRTARPHTIRVGSLCLASGLGSSVMCS